jgi:4-hydroxybenzoate polyprenyltransferase
VKHALAGAVERWKIFFTMRHHIFALSIALVSIMLSARATRGWPGWKTFILVPTGVFLLKVCCASYKHIVHLRTKKSLTSSPSPGSLETDNARAGAWFFLLTGAFGFVVCCGIANSLCLFISPFLLAAVCFYPHFQRMSDYSTLYPGVIHALLPLWAWIAATGSIRWEPFALGIIALFWAGGLATLESIRTLDSDHANGRHSLPISWGTKNALSFAFLLHLLTVMAMAVFSFFALLKIAYLVSVGFITLCVLIEHWIAKIRKQHWLGDAFFRLNLVVSIVFTVAFACEMAFPFFNFSVR